MATRGSSQKPLKKYKDQSATGYPRDVLEKVKSKSKNFVERYKPTLEYIGYAGHPSDDYKAALKSRQDSRKRELRINATRSFYKTTSRDHAKTVEKNLIQYSQDHHKNINENKACGGGGSEGKDDKYFYVYAAYHVHT